jgi:uncharacterized protein YndB with AHSA1/START domain
MAEATTAGFTVRQSIEIEAPRERVWDLITDPEKAQSWMPMVAFGDRVGERYDFKAGQYHASGQITEYDPPRLVAFTWDWLNSPIGAETEVRFELEEKDGRTLVHLTHVGLPTDESRSGHDHGWDHYMKRLAVVGAGGDPGPDTMAQDM